MTAIHTRPAIHRHAVLPDRFALLPRLIGEVITPFEVGQELASGVPRP